MAMLRTRLKTDVKETSYKDVEWIELERMAGTWESESVKSLLADGETA